MGFIGKLGLDTINTAHEILHRARANADAGQYAAALRDHLWFHQHALAEEPALCGVRLSFALGDWVELGKKYPPALVKLRVIRDQTLRRLFGPRGTFEQFHDIASINEYLGAETETYRAFCNLCAVKPKLAEHCADVAMNSIVAAADFKLAAKYWPAPESGLLQFAELFNTDVQRHKQSPKIKAPRLQAYTDIYCGRVRTTMRIAGGLGYQETSELTREWAVALVEDGLARRMVTQRLFGSLFKR